MTTVLARMTAGWPEDRLQRWAIGSLYAMAFFSPVSISLGQLAQFITVMVAVVYVVRHRRALLGQPLPASLLSLALFFALYVVVRGYVAAGFERPDLAAQQWEGVATWYKSAILPVLVSGLVLAATGNWLRHGLGVLVALLLGYTLSVLVINLEPSSLLQALVGGSRYKPESGFRVGALVLPALIMGLAAFVPYLLSRLSSNALGNPRLLNLTGGLVMTALVFSFAAILIATKSRNGWLALLFGASVMAIVGLWAYRRELLHPGRTTLIGMLVIGVAVGGLVATGWETIDKRWDQTSRSVEKVLSLPFGETEVEDLRRDSVGVRVAYWAFGWERFLDRPWVGYGPADQRHLTEEHPIPHQLRNRNDTYHNSHIDILLRFGLVGFVPIYFVLLVLVNEARRNLARAGAERVLGLYVIGFMVTMAAWAMNAQILHRFAVEHVYGLVIGLMAASLFARYAHREPEQDG